MTTSRYSSDTTDTPVGGIGGAVKRAAGGLAPRPDDGCLCDHRYGSYGRLYGISMGDGWIRTSTHPDCPHHSEGRSA